MLPFYQLVDNLKEYGDMSVQLPCFKAFCLFLIYDFSSYFVIRLTIPLRDQLYLCVEIEEANIKQIIVGSLTTYAA